MHRGIKECIKIFMIITTVNSINYEKLMKEYFLLCGPDYFCFPPNVTHRFEIFPEKDYTYQNLCPKCTCDRACVSRGDCCADVFFKLPELDCVNRTIIKAVSDVKYETNAFYLMVRQCPPGTTRELNELCTGDHSTEFNLVNLPVYDPTYNISYRNTYCAECNNVTKYYSWNLDINCKQFADFNFLSSLNKVIDLANQRKCIFQAYESNENKLYNLTNCDYLLKHKNLISKCNETSHWMIEDTDIKAACESSFVGRYKSFKNVFCYMCNIPSNSDVSKDICNETGVWKPFDEGIQTACADLPASNATSPYKNIFCFICNRDNFHNSQTSDIFTSISEAVYVNETIVQRIRVQTIAINIDYLNELLLRRIKNSSGLEDPVFKMFSKEMINLKGQIVDLRHLFGRYLELSKTIPLCPARHGLLNTSAVNTNCTCDPLCVFDLTRTLPCCQDSSLELPVQCMKSDELSNPFPSGQTHVTEGHLVIDGCLQHSTTELFKGACGRRSFNDAFSLLPFSHIGNYASFQNFYCVLCNLNISSYTEQMMGETDGKTNIFTQNLNNFSSVLQDYAMISDEYKPWDLLFHCNKYVDYIHYPLLSEIIQLMKQSGCNITYDEIAPTRRCIPHREICKRERWEFTDDAVEQACAVGYGLDPWVPKRMKVFENSIYNFRHYANAYCAHCSYSSTYDLGSFIDECNVTGFWNSSDNSTENRCKDVPFFPYYFPFKNEFCASCNAYLYSKKINIIAGEIIRVDHSYFHVPVLRDMFRIDFENIDNAKGNRKCHYNQVNDNFAGTCRNILCYPGKYLKHSECHALFHTTKNLHYSMSFGISSCENTTNDRTHDIYRASQYAISRKLGLDTVGFHIHKISVYNAGYSILDGFVYMDCFIAESIRRVEVERLLINFVSTNNTLNISEYSYYISPSTLGYTLAQQNNSSNDRKRRFVKNENRYRKAKISELLLCTQIALYVDEYRITPDQNNSYLLLTRINAALGYDEFDIMPNGEIRVCLDTLNKMNYFEKKVSSMEMVLAYLNVSCSTLSIVCLLFFLITYSLFPNLRTVAGKLMMLLVSALLFTLMFSSFSFFFMDSTLGCTIVGILLHFFWLVVFASMQVCSFHMYKQFKSSAPPRFRPNVFFINKLCLYILYAVLLPASIVLVHIVTSLIRSNHIGYGGSKCFISYPIEKIFSFIVPVLLVCISNLYFFLSTMLLIHNTPSPRSNQESRGELKVCIRLSTITGVAWIFQILDSFLPISSFSFVATAICSLQGLFIFLAFVGNHRILNLYKKILREKLGQVKTTSSSNTITTANTRITISKVTKL